MAVYKYFLRSIRQETTDLVVHGASYTYDELDEQPLMWNLLKGFWKIKLHCFDLSVVVETYSKVLDCCLKLAENRLHKPMLVVGYEIGISLWGCGRCVLPPCNKQRQRHWTVVRRLALVYLLEYIWVSDLWLPLVDGCLEDPSKCWFHRISHIFQEFGWNLVWTRCLVGIKTFQDIPQHIFQWLWCLVLLG